MTLREAIRTLRQAGYVESRRGRYGGTFVSPTPPRPRRHHLTRPGQPTGGGIGDTLILREVLEVGAARVAAQQQLSGAERAHLRRRLDETAAATQATYRRLDSRLHLAIAEGTGSPSLTAAVADVRMPVNELLDTVSLLARDIAHSNQQHAAIVEAIVAGDPDAAAGAMAEHLAGTAALLRGLLA